MTEDLTIYCKSFKEVVSRKWLEDYLNTNINMLYNRDLNYFKLNNQRIVENAELLAEHEFGRVVEYTQSFVNTIAKYFKQIGRAHV